MSYKSSSIAEIIGKLNTSYFLPAIQRPFVWETEQIIRLFDSLMQGYPISSFLFWDLKEENRNNWETYKFIDNFKFGEIHDEKMQESHPGGINLVLDGQQRLTSLFIGLKGTYTTRLKNQRKNNPNAWVTQLLYLDLLKDPEPTDIEAEDDFYEDISYGFKFYDEKIPPQQGRGHYWFKVGRILDCSDRDQYYALQDELIEDAKLTASGDKRVFRDNLDKLYQVVWKDEAISHYTEKSQSYDKVLDIFIRANDGGTKLSKSDLLMSMVTLKWSELNARDEINEVINFINIELPKENGGGLDKENDIDRDFILRASLVLSELDFGFKVENFTKDNLELIQSNWHGIRMALIEAFRLVNSFGLFKHNLTSLNAVMPIYYFLHRLYINGVSMDMKISRSDAEMIRRWISSALLNGIFGGQANVTMGLSRTLIREAMTKSSDFPADVLVKTMTLRRRIMDFDDDAIEKFLNIEYRARLGFVALALIYDRTDWQSINFQKTNVFPYDLFDEIKLRSIGVASKDVAAYLDRRDKICNLILVTPDEYTEKCQTEFYEWAMTRDVNFFKNHLLPSDKHLYEPENFLAFVEARESMITDHLRTLFNTVTA